MLKLNKKISTILAIFLIIATFSFFHIPKSEAAWIPGIDPIISETLKDIHDQINGVIMGAAKQAALSALNMQISILIGGGKGGGSLIISDYNDYLFKQPEAKANAFLNDYLSQTTAGRGSASYIPNNEGFGNNAVAEDMMQNNPSYASLVNTAQAAGINLNINSMAGNYMQKLVNSAKASILPPSSAPQVTYTGDPSQMFASGNFRNMSLYLSGVNNPWAFNLNAQQAYQNNLQQQQTIADTQAKIGQGYASKTASNGQVITPGSTIKDLESGINDLPNKLIAQANSLPEILTAFVGKMVAQTITQGIGNISAQIGKNVINVKAQATQQLNSEVQQMGPAALFKH